MGNITESKALGNSEKIMSFKSEEIFVANSIVCTTYRTSSVTVLSKPDVGITIKNSLHSNQQCRIPTAEENSVLEKMISHKLCLWLRAICSIFYRLTDLIIVGHCQYYATL